MKNPFTWIGLAAVLCWSFLGPLVRTGLEHTPLFTFATLLQGGSFLVLCGWTLLKRHSLTSALRPSPRRLTIGVLYFAYSMLCNLVLISSDTHMAVIAGLMVINFWPILSMLIGVPMLGLRLRPVLFGLGILFTIIGGLLIVGEGASALPDLLSRLNRQPLVFILALTAAVTWSICSNLMKKWANDGDDYMPFNLGLSALVLLPFTASSILAQLGAQGVTLSLLILILLNAAGFLFWEIGLRRGHVPTVITAAYFIPLTTALASAWYFQLALTPSLFLAGLSISIGALISRTAVKPV